MKGNNSVAPSPVDAPSKKAKHGTPALGRATPEHQQSRRGSEQLAMIKQRMSTSVGRYRQSIVWVIATCVGVSATNTLFFGITLTALAYDIMDGLYADLSATTSFQLDNFPAYTTTVPLKDWGYAPCDTWLQDLLIVDPAAGDTTDTLQVSNDIKNYLEYESVVSITQMMKKYTGQPLPPQDAALNSACAVFRDGWGVMYAMGNLHTEYLARLRGLETLHWVDRHREAFPGILDYLDQNPDAHVMIYSIIWNHKESTASNGSPPPNLAGSKTILLRLYKGDVKTGEIRLNPKNKDEVDFHHGREFIAEAVMWGYTLNSCDDTCLTRLLQVNGTYTDEQMTKACGKVLAEGGTFLAQQLHYPLSRTPNPPAPQLLPYQQFGASAILLAYIVPKGKGRDFVFSTRDTWTGTYASRFIAVTKVISSPNYEPVVETGVAGGVRGGHLGPQCTNSVTTLSERQTGTYVANGTFACDIQIFLYLLSMIVGNGVHYIPTYLRKISVIYMLSRSSVLYIVMIQYALWNYSNVPSMIHLVRVNYRSSWTNLRFIKNVIMTSYLVAIGLYRIVFEQQVRSFSIVMITASVGIYYGFRVGLAHGDMAKQIIDNIKDVRLQNTVSTVQDPACFFASICYQRDVVGEFYLRLYLPIVILVLVIVIVDKVHQKFSMHRKPSPSARFLADSNAGEAALSCFESSCLLSSMREYFGHDGDFYGDDVNASWCVKEEYMIMSGYSIAADKTYIVRNRDLICLWISELVPPVILRSSQINLSMTYWPVIDGHVQLGRHFVIDGPLRNKRVAAARCGPQAAKPRAKKAAEEAPSSCLIDKAKPSQNRS